MRPVLMTCVAACVGLLPAAFSTAIGSQVQRPLAIVVVGGTLIAPLLFLTVLPAAIGLFSRRRPHEAPAPRRRAGAAVMRRLVRRLPAAAVLAGCTLGPDFQRPDPPKARAYLPDTTTDLVAGGIDGGEAQRIVQGLDIPGQWWGVFQSPSSTA